MGTHENSSFQEEPNEPVQTLPVKTTGGASYEMTVQLIWQQLNDVNRTLGKLESSVNTLTTKTESLEKKVSSLSSWKTAVMAIIAFIIAATSITAAVVGFLR